MIQYYSIFSSMPQVTVETHSPDGSPCRDRWVLGQSVHLLDNMILSFQKGMGDIYRCYRQQSPDGACWTWLGVFRPSARAERLHTNEGIGIWIKDANASGEAVRDYLVGLLDYVGVDQSTPLGQLNLSNMLAAAQRETDEILQALEKSIAPFPDQDRGALGKSKALRSFIYHGTVQEIGIGPVLDRVMEDRSEFDIYFSMDRKVGDELQKTLSEYRVNREKKVLSKREKNVDELSVQFIKCIFNKLDKEVDQRSKQGIALEKIQGLREDLYKVGKYIEEKEKEKMQALMGLKATSFGLGLFVIFLLIPILYLTFASAYHDRALLLGGELPSTPSNCALPEQKIERFNTMLLGVLNDSAPSAADRVLLEARLLPEVIEALECANKAQ